MERRKTAYIFELVASLFVVVMLFIVEIDEWAHRKGLSLSFIPVALIFREQRFFELENIPQTTRDFKFGPEISFTYVITFIRITGFLSFS